MVSLNAWALYLSCLRLTYNLTIISPRLDTGFLLGITRLGVSPNYLICTEPAHHKFDYILNIFHGENKILKIGSLASQVSIIYILNVLYSCLYEIDYNKNKERIENYSEYLRNKNII